MGQFVSIMNVQLTGAFSKYDKNAIIYLRVLGIRYELNDEFISIIATFYNT